MTGLVSLTHAGFYGIGAYTTAILSTHFQLSFWLNLPIAMIITLLIALLLALIALRTIEDYFVICTLGLQIIIFTLMNNLISLTNGPLGISGIAPINIFGVAITNKLTFLFFSFTLLFINWFILKNMFSSSFGKRLQAISQDEIYSQSIGINTYQTKIIAFVISAVIASVPGVLYAHYVSYIDPTSFSISESIFILSIVILGGMRNLWGSFLGSAFLIFLPEILRFLGLPNNVAANLRQIIYGTILIIIMMNGQNSLFNLFNLSTKK